MKKFTIAALVLLPMLASAQAFNNVNTLLLGIKNLVNTALPLVVGLALLFFFWGLARFILSAGNEDAKEKAKNLMIYSIIALFVMVSVWGLVQFIGQALGVNQNVAPGTISVPSVGNVQ